MEKFSSCNCSADTCAIVAPIDRVDCGWPGVTKEQCLQKGCCFDSSIPETRFCFYKAGKVLFSDLNFT